MDHGAGIDDYLVEIGVERCRVIHLLENLLTCEPPESKPNPGDNATEDGTVTVTVSFLGHSLRNANISVSFRTLKINPYKKSHFHTFSLVLQYQNLNFFLL